MSQVDITGVQHYTVAIGHPNTPQQVGGAFPLMVDETTGQIDDPSAQAAVRGAVGGVIVAADSAAAASANREAIQAALDTGGKVVVDGGIVYVDGTVYVGDNTEFLTAPGTTIKQADGTNALMVGTKQLNAAWSNVSIAWTAGKNCTMTWAGHGLALNDAVVLQGVPGTTAGEWFETARVQSVTDANNVVLRLPFIPTAAPSGQMTAKRCHRNVVIDVSIDYNKTGNGLAGQPNYARMGVVAAFLADSEVWVRGNDLYKYVVMVAGADNVTGGGYNGAIANSDTVKIYGPSNNVTMEASGRASEDCASTQMLEPAAFVNYMPCRGALHSITIDRPAASALTAGSGAVVIYGDDTFPADNILIQGGECKSAGSTMPGLAVKSGVGFAGSASKLRDVTVRGTRVGGAGYAAFELNTYVRRLVFDRASFEAPDSATVRCVRVPSGGSVDELIFDGLEFDGGSWPTATGYFLEVGNGGIAKSIVFRRCSFRGSSAMRVLLALSGCTVSRVIFDECTGTNIDAIARIEQAGITVVFRGGNYSGVLVGANMRVSGRVVIEGSPNISGMTNGLIRAEIAGTVVDVEASGSPQISSGALFVALTSAVINPKSDRLSLDIGATGVNKAAGNRAFNTATRGTIPANVSVVCDGTNWYNACNLSQTF